MNYVIIFAGGIGLRMGSDIPKQFLKINDTEIIVHTLEKFNNNNSIDSILIVSLKEYIPFVKNLVIKFHLNKVIDVIEGGATAFSSQFNGISYIANISKNNDDIVLVHDGVRPLINDQLILKCIEEVKKNGNAITVSRVTETVVKKGTDKIQEIIPREQCLLARAPQCFFVKDLFKAHLKANKEGKQYIDSASLMMDLGEALNPIEGPNENIKITTQYDYLVAKLLIKEKPWK